MGKNYSKLSEATVQELLQQRRDGKSIFTENELKIWHKEFIRTCPEGKMTEDYLIQIYQGLCCEGNVEPFAKQVFRTLDTNKDGRISFKELMISLIPTITGDIDDKLRWAFKMFDEDENNQISSDEVYKISHCVYQMVKNPADSNSTFDTISKTRGNELFESMDEDKDDCITLEEFMIGAKKNPQIIEMLQSDLTHM